ncbi:MAG: DNA cytosine methyltransferase [Planctomycetaceae bacterium]|jgi:DNA (cytosine-5)-methyltransferase 1|nr:DNA cytosine methyltransferase [Planctomycetaceae bacterium]
MKKETKRSKKKKSNIRIIDLFSGAGGLTLGFTRFAPISTQIVWANDFNHDAVETYNKNFGNHCIEGDLSLILANKNTKIPKADIVIGGPPCQGFSLLNKNRDNDERKQLWQPYMEVVKMSGAGIFVMENVPQLLNTNEYKEIIMFAENIGFKTISAILGAADYGVSQIRRRAFIVGCSFIDPKEFFPPRKTHYNPEKPFDKYLDELSNYIENPKPWNTVRTAIEDLEPPLGVEIRKITPPYDLHFGRTPTDISLKRYKAIPIEGMNRFDLQKRAPELVPACWIRKTKGGTDLFGRLWWDKPAFTIRTEFFKPEKGRTLHPQQHRPITHREAARLQSFPDDFHFIGTKIEIAKQIGNAVPPLLATRVAESVLSAFAGN